MRLYSEDMEVLNLIERAKRRNPDAFQRANARLEAFVRAGVPVLPKRDLLKMFQEEEALALEGDWKSRGLVPD